MKRKQQRKVRPRGLLVTGASGGIGLAVARHYLAQDWKVVLQYHARRTDVAKLLKQYPNQAFSLACDFRQPAEIKALAKGARKLLGQIDAVINCVGVASPYVPVETTNRNDWQVCFDINTMGAIALAQNVIQPLLNTRGTFLQVSTNAIKFRGRNSLPYTTSKLAAEFALESFFKIHYARGVRFNILRVGVIASGMKDRVKLYSERQFKKRVGLIPAGRCGTIEDVIRSCNFLVDTPDNFVCGANLALTGGE